MQEVDRLPPRQRAVFEFIRDTVQRSGVCPSFREIARHFGISSPNGVTVHLRALERKGFITQDRGRNRAIRILRRDLSGMPVAGVVGAGPLSEAIEAVTSCGFEQAICDASMNGAVVVSDDSLLHERIIEGDYLIGPREGGRIKAKWLVRRFDD